MSDQEKMGRLAQTLAAVEAFKELSEAEVEELGATLELRFVARGSFLVREGEQADTLFLVLSGRFRVYRDDRADAFAEIGSGRLVKSPSLLEAPEPPRYERSAIVWC